LTVVGVLSGWSYTRWDARVMPKLLAPLAFATPLFIVLVLPALVLSFHGLRGAKLPFGSCPSGWLPLSRCSPHRL